MSTPPSSDHDLLIEIKTLVKALTEIVTGYGKDIRSLDARVDNLTQRTIVLETRSTTDDRRAASGLSRRAVFWTATGAVVMLAGVIVSITVAVVHG